jgi:hypothetical protein
VNLNLQHDIRELLNRHSAENGSNTPDFLLASFLMKCLAAWEDTVVDRDRWFSNFPPTQQENVEGPK